MIGRTWAPAARPQTPSTILTGTADTSIIDAARARDVRRIVHFTRIGGLKGILSTGVVRARADLPEDARVRHVYEENAADRSRDLEWHAYVNLSIGKISSRMFKFSKREHPNDDWVILEFAPEILGDPGVVFSTTNNAYENAHRALGIEGFLQLYAPEVPWGHYGSVSTRHGRPDDEPTNSQAEVLYPHQLTLEHLVCVTVGNEDVYETVAALFVHFPVDAKIDVRPEAFA